MIDLPTINVVNISLLFTVYIVGLAIAWGVNKAIIVLNTH